MNRKADISGTDLDTSDEALKLDAQLCFSVYTAMHAFNKAYRHALKDLGLTYPQYLVMMVLWEKDSLTVSTICEELQLETTTVTPLLKRMEANGLLSRTRSKEDERQVIVSLTEQGRAMKEAARDVPACMTRAVALPDDEFNDLKGMLEKLRGNLTASL